MSNILIIQIHALKDLNHFRIEARTLAPLDRRVVKVLALLAHFVGHALHGGGARGQERGVREMQGGVDAHVHESDERSEWR